MAAKKALKGRKKMWQGNIPTKKNCSDTEINSCAFCGSDHFYFQLLRFAAAQINLS